MPKRSGGRGKNSIKKLEDTNGVVHSGDAMGHAATSYFQSIFTADPLLDPSPIVQLMQTHVNDEINESLCAEFTEQEIADAVFQIGPLKAPGLDGFPARFFQRNWSTVRADVIAAVKEFFTSGIMPDSVNDTIIVLIPKIPNPVKLIDFSPY